MKHKMTVEESDLRDFVTKFLALHGVQPQDDIQFLDGMGERVEGLHIDVDCQLAPIPPECPLCGKPKTRRSQKTSSSPKSAVPERGEIEVQSELEKEDVSADDDMDETPMSMAAIRAASNQLIASRGRDQPKPKIYMPGESDVPPGPGEGHV